MSTIETCIDSAASLCSATWAAVASLRANVRECMREGTTACGYKHALLVPAQICR